MKDKQATGGTIRPNQNEFHGKNVPARKPDDAGLRPATTVPGHKRGNQGKG